MEEVIEKNRLGNGKMYNPDRHHRKSIRLKGYDYSQEGYYFITICTQNRENLFSEIVHHQMILNNCGIMLQDTWNEIPEYYAGIKIDAFQIMPNHIHGIIVIGGAGPCACPIPRQTTTAGEGQPQGVAPTALTLPDIVHRFKTMTTKWYVDGVKNDGWKSFDKRLWQRNYHEHIIRNEQELLRIWKYIQHNPVSWVEDCFNE